MQHCDKIPPKILFLKNRHYISAQKLEDFTCTKFSQKRRLIQHHVSAAIINILIPAD